MGFAEYARATADATAAREAESSMAGAYASLSVDEQRRATDRAAAVMTAHPEASSCAACHAASRKGACEHSCCGVPSGSTAAFVVRNVLTPDECARVLDAVCEAAARRGGWGSRHHKHPTADLGVGAVPDVELLLRDALFARLLRPLCSNYFCAPFLPEHLRFNDLFFVRYSADAADDAPTSLPLHTDGSVFSFNVLLNSPADFEGGGTCFADGSTLSPPSEGGAVVHSGQVRHGGAPITRGERYLLVGFVGTEQAPYSARLARWAAVSAFGKFGHAAWKRPSGEDAPHDAPEADENIVRHHASPTPTPR